MSGIIIIGVDVEMNNEKSVNYANYGAELFHCLETPVTWYVTCKVLEKYAKLFSAMKNDPLIDLQCHTYSHLLLKTVCMKIPRNIKFLNPIDGYFIKEGATLEEIEKDLTKCDKIFKAVLGRAPQGLCGPWNYYRGLSDRPDILKIVDRHGYQFLRMASRDQNDFEPIPFEYQPFFYKPQGYPHILELPVNGYQDDYSWKAIGRKSKKENYIEYLKQMARVVAKKNLVWGLCSHDHDCASRAAFASRKAWLKEIILYAKSIGIMFMSAKQYYSKAAKKK